MAGPYRLLIEQGADYRRTFTLYEDEAMTAPTNLTNYTALAQLKTSKGVSLLELNDAAGLTLGGIGGTIAMAITKAQVASLPTSPDGVWALFLTSPTAGTQRLLTESFTVLPLGKVR